MEPSSPPASLMGGVAAPTPDAPTRKRPASRAPNILAKILLNSGEDIYQSFMEDLRTKYVSLAAWDSKRERHIRVLRSLRLGLQIERKQITRVERRFADRLRSDGGSDEYGKSIVGTTMCC